MNKWIVYHSRSWILNISRVMIRLKMSKAFLRPLRNISRFDQNVQTIRWKHLRTIFLFIFWWLEWFSSTLNIGTDCVLCSTAILSNGSSWGERPWDPRAMRQSLALCWNDVFISFYAIIHAKRSESWIQCYIVSKYYNVLGVGDKDFTASYFTAWLFLLSTNLPSEILVRSKVKLMFKWPFVYGLGR